MEDDSTLVSKYRLGDLGALATLVHKYTKPVYNFVYRFGNSTDADDITQETFIKVWKYLNRYDTAKPFAPWLFQIASRTCIDWFRKKKDITFSDLDPQDSNKTFAENIQDHSALPDDLFIQQEYKTIIDIALAKLPPLYRAVMTLRYMEGYDIDEIATILEKPAETIKSQHYRALQMLKKQIKALHP